MKRVLFVLVIVLVVAALPAEDRRWENPVFESVDLAEAAARQERRRLGPESPLANRLFVSAMLPAADETRFEMESFVITHPSAMHDNPTQRTTVERFTGQLPRQSRTIERRLGRFGFPDLSGLVFCRLVGSVDAFSNLNRASSDRMSRVGGVTYFCRYIVLPLSYVGEEDLRRLEQEATLNPAMDVDATRRRWQRESYASLVNTFRHELVHVHTNSAIGLPSYTNRSLFPVWFHEGTATYLAGDPHSGLSARYQTYQNAFFYLVQRFGVTSMRRFFESVFGGADVATSLDEVFEIESSGELFLRAGRWHAWKRRAVALFWVVGFTIVAAAFRGYNVPVIGALMLVAAASIIVSVLTGLAQHLVGLSGPGAVLAVQLGLISIALALAVRGALRIRRVRHRSGA